MSNEKVKIASAGVASDRNADLLANQTRAVLSPEEKKAILTRFSKAIGHLQSVKRMVENECDVEKTLVQLSAVRAALYGVSRSLVLGLCENRNSDITDDSEGESIRDVLDLMERYLR